MIVADFADENISSVEWKQIHDFKPEPQSGLIKIETRESVIFVYSEELEQICNYIAGKKEIPSLEDGEDILGDIEAFDISVEHWIYGYGWNCTIEDINGLVIANPPATNCTWKRPTSSSIHKDNNGSYLEERYSLRKGYPSFLFKLRE